MRSRIPGLVLISALVLPSAGHACGDPGFLIAFNPLGDETQVVTSPAAPQTVVAGPPQTVYEGGWGSAKTLFVSRTDCLREAATDPPEAMLRYAVRAAFSAAPRGALVVPERVPSQCSAPMVLIGLTRVTDPEKNGAYSRAVVKSNLPRLHGFVPLFSGQPMKLLSGEWPQGYSASVSTWPCKAAYDSFYFGEEYVRQIKPLRAGAGEYIILGFAPNPAAEVRDAALPEKVSQ